MKLFTAENRNTIRWASGTSTEIFIYPANGSFAELNFIFRISTATVEAEESKFTFFEGITRHLMLLKGELDLMHEGRYSKYLKPFDQDIFSGEWTTASRGKVTDFNLMLKGDADGSLLHHQIKKNHSKIFQRISDFHFLYIASGNATANDLVVKAGDLLFFEDDIEIKVYAETECDVIEISVNLNNN